LTNDVIFAIVIGMNKPEDQNDNQPLTPEEERQRNIAADEKSRRAFGKLGIHSEEVVPAHTDEDLEQQFESPAFDPQEDEDRNG
jgi:hypothetical protein